MEHEEIKNKAIRGVIALTGRTMVLQVFNTIAFVILAAILSPSQIGVFIIVSAVIRIFNLFTDVGLGAALVQKKDKLHENDLKVAFTIQEILVVFAIALGFIFRHQVQAWARLDAEGLMLYLALLVILFISSLKVIPSILLERKLSFEKQIIPQVVEAIVFDVLVVFLALKGLGISSYTWAFLASAIIGLPIYYLISPWRPGLAFSVSHAKKLLTYGVAYQGKSFLAVLKDDLLTFFLAGVVGPSGVGYWGTAQKWAYFPYRFLVDSITKVSFPAYARIQHEKSALSVGIEKSLFAVSLTLFPILTLFCVLAPNLIVVFPKYSQWAPALISLYFLSGQAGVAGLTNVLVNVLDATGRVKTTLSLMVMWIVSTWLLTLFFVSKVGFTGIAIAAFIVSLSIIIVIFLVKRVTDFSFFGSIWRQCFSCLIMGVSVYWLAHKLPVNLFTLLVIILCAGLIYLTMMFALARKELLLNLRIIIRAYKK